ncbi:hypothetical protein BGZ65_001516 [Modicella reniformis]|uniref:Uncharacterized protein n=1 Tax=Modicella reniformis TaxID=1440133 RepID=A0A9P6IP67_9FUNG|nr:hypothetical protein BGZ65_001516 [Modicella reniformis]
MSQNDGIFDLVDETSKVCMGAPRMEPGPMRSEDIEALEGADLRQIQLHLSGKHKGGVLGRALPDMQHRKMTLVNASLHSAKLREGCSYETGAPGHRAAFAIATVAVLPKRFLIGPRIVWS